MKPRRPVNLTSPAPCGAFLFPSSQPRNRAAQAPPFAFKGRLPSALPLSPFRPVPPRLVKARPAFCPVRPCRPPAACERCAAGFSAAPPPVAGAVRRLPLPRAALCRPVRGFPFPCPVRRPAAACLVKPLPPACRRPRAAPEGRQPLPLPVITVRRCRPRPAAAGFREGVTET
jgi:hypothetical protein